MPAVILFLVTLLVPAARARPCSAKRSGAQPRVSTEGANDTSIPCAVGTYPINRGATLHVTTTEPPYALCLRHDQVVDNGVRTLGRWPDCMSQGAHDTSSWLSQAHPRPHRPCEPPEPP